jgi:CBS domain-containing protein
LTETDGFDRRRGSGLRTGEPLAVQIVGQGGSDRSGGGRE